MVAACDLFTHTMAAFGSEWSKHSAVLHSSGSSSCCPSTTKTAGSCIAFGSKLKDRGPCPAGIHQLASCGGQKVAVMGRALGSREPTAAASCETACLGSHRSQRLLGGQCQFHRRRIRWPKCRSVLSCVRHRGPRRGVNEDNGCNRYLANCVV